MTDDVLINLRKKLRYMSGHRGMRELDLLLEPFAEATTPQMTEIELNELNVILSYPEDNLYGWLMKQKPVPEGVKTAIFKQLQAFIETQKLSVQYAK